MYKKRHKENRRKSVSTNTDSEGKSSNPDENGSQVENWTFLYLLSVDQ